MSVSISFEVFPPKTPAGMTTLTGTAHQLATTRPEFISVTYGAGGTNSDHSMAAIRAVQHSGPTDIAAHLTCVGQSRAELDRMLDDYDAVGVRHVVALRGDPAEGVDAPYEPHPDGYHSTANLVAAIKQRSGYEVSVSAYPERHPQSPSDAHDLDVLAEKVDAGADRAITQMFFDNAHFLRLRERARRSGIEIPIVPGIFPIHSFPETAVFAARCGTTIPAQVADRFEGLAGDRQATRHVAAELCAEQIAELVEHGVEHVHIYTLNRADLVLDVCERLGLVEQAEMT